ncbi:MAG: SPOR domain-containing protein [Gemmatimonadota bacterium]|nr:SPOR domain-containing protein [Gemmatimonadota bacterium]
MTHRSFRNVRVLAVIVFCASSLVAGRPTRASAQSQLEEVEQLTRLGRADEARVLLAEWWEGDRADASRGDLQRGLWLRGRLTVDPVQAELDFERLAVLYPSGRFTADAILRLAQASWAMGDEDRTRTYVATLERDYARSDAWGRAEAWIADRGPLPPPGDTPSGAEPPGGGRTERQAAPTRSPPTGPTGAAAADPTMNYFVQLGAFADEERAMSLYEAVAAEGVDARVVRVAGSQFTHVRVGRFAERAAAVELLEELTSRGINAALVRDDRAESPIRD